MPTETMTSPSVLPNIEDMPLHLLGNHPAEEYCRNVLTGETVACKWVKLACLRHLMDLRDGGERGLSFDRAAAEHRIEFYRFCRHFEGEWAGQVIQPEPWQQFVNWVVYGWKRADGTRRFRRVYESVARKNGKSTIVATDGIYLAFFDGEPGAQVYTAATKEKQAKIIHGASTRMVKSSKALSRMIRVFRNNLHVESTASKYEPLGQDSHTEDGLNIHAGLIDEYHAHPDDGMYNVLRSGMGARRQPILWVITTAGFDKDCACHIEQEYAQNVLEGIFDDDSYFAIIYTPDNPDDWTNEIEWMKANPNLGVSIYIDDFREQAEQAKRVPSKQNEFKTKRLNIWTESMQAWITSEMWAKCGGAVDVEGLRGRKCYGAFDLSSTTDISAWALCFPPETEDDTYKFLWRFFVPQADLETRYPNRHVLNNIRTWIRQGFVFATPSNYIDYDFIRAQILEDAATFDIQSIPFDIYNASQLVNDLTKEDLNLVEFRQGYLSMSPAAKDFEQKVLSGQISHGNNPVMRWMIACTELSTDPTGNIKPVKPARDKSDKRIDGVIAAIMALSAAVRGVESADVGMEVW